MRTGYKGVESLPQMLIMGPGRAYHSFSVIHNTLVIKYQEVCKWQEKRIPRQKTLSRSGKEWDIFPEGWDISAVRALDEQETTGQNMPGGNAADGSSSMPAPSPDNGNKPVTGEDEGAPVTSIAADILCRMGLTDFRMICPEKDIFIEQWVRFRCMFGCGNYGKSGSCPPAVPSVAECREAIMGYRTAILIHQTIPFESRESYEEMSNQLHAKLLEAERQLFLAGCYKALLLSHTDCHICASCRANGNRENCVCKTKSRPSVEAMGIDVYKTARSAGYEIDVVRDIGTDTNRFAIILLD